MTLHNQKQQEPLPGIFLVYHNTKLIAENRISGSKVTKIFLNLATGQLTKALLISSQGWSPIMLQENPLSISFEKMALKDRARRVMKLTNVFLQGLGAKQESEGNLLKLFLETAPHTFGYKKSEKTSYERICTLCEDQLSQVAPTTGASIMAMHSILFETFLIKHAQKDQLKKHHIAAIVKSLFKVINAYWKKGEKSFKPTGTGEKEFEGINASYYMLGKEGNPLWVFKPVEKMRKLKGVIPESIAKREHLAHLLNRKKTYPIPYTVYLSLHGKNGSAQKYIAQATDYENVVYEQSFEHNIDRAIS